MESGFVFPERWFDLRGHGKDEDDARARLEAEIAREIADGHVLAGEAVQAVAACTHCDDVLFALSEDRFAVVHLSYPNPGPDRPPWPHTDIYEQWAGVAAFVDDHEDA